MSSRVSSTSIFNHLQGEKQGFKGERPETLNRKDRTAVTPTGYVQYNVGLLTDATVYEKAPKRDEKTGTPICLEDVNGTPYIVDSMPRKTPIGNALATYRAPK